MNVVHLKRSYLYRTEVFVYTQLLFLNNTRSTVLVRDVQNHERFPGPVVRAFSNQPRQWQRYWADINYRFCRRMSAMEQKYYRYEVQTFMPDVMHAHFAVDASYFIDLKHYFDIPLIVSCYGYDVSSFPRQYLGLGRQYLKRVWETADIVLAMSNDMRSDLLQIGCPDQKIHLHYHGINLDRFTYTHRAFGSESTVILFVGSLDVEKKGVEQLIRAFAHVTEQRPNVRLRLVGKGQAKIESLVRTLGLERQVSYAGFVSHDRLSEEYGAADIFCHPSFTTTSGDKEGIPGTIVEAMATGLPIVTTRHAGIPEIVIDGKHGFIGEERDIDAIAQSLLYLIDNPSARSQFGINAAHRAHDKANAARQAQVLESIYESVYATANRKVSR